MSEEWKSGQTEERLNGKIEIRSNEKRIKQKNGNTIRRQQCLTSKLFDDKIFRRQKFVCVKLVLTSILF